MAEEIRPVIQILAKEAELTEVQAVQVFRILFLAVYGYASMLANNDMELDEEAIMADLTTVFYGAIGVMKERSMI